MDWSAWKPIKKWLAGFAVGVIVPLLLLLLDKGAGLLSMSKEEYITLIIGEGAVLLGVYIKKETTIYDKAPPE